jgi:predicted helicase
MVVSTALYTNFKEGRCLTYIGREGEFETREDKLAFLKTTNVAKLTFEELEPDARGFWINLTNNDFDSLVPIATREAKAAKRAAGAKAIFKLYSLGVSTNRDEWIVDFSEAALSKKMSYFVERYHTLLRANGSFETDIKWSRNLKRRFEAKRKEPFSPDRVVRVAYRPYVDAHLYNSELFIDERGSAPEIFPSPETENVAIAFIGDATEKPFSVLVTSRITDLNFLSPAAAGTKLLPLNRFIGEQLVPNITDWAHEQFRKHYQTGRRRPARPIDKAGIFNYVYGVLHDPLYREKYALNLKRDFPRIPFYENFWRWADWGKELMELHLGYRSISPTVLRRVDKPRPKDRVHESPTTILRADRAAGRILLDSDTSLADIPPVAWEYRIGNRCVLEWILDQYKEGSPKDPTIRAKFNTYNFAAYKDFVIDLLMRATTVSVRTCAITDEMKEVSR